MPPIETTTIVWAGVGIAAIILIIVLVRKAGAKEPDYLKAVRDAASRGDHGRAGEIQLKHGNLPEALNLFVRGGLPARAAIVSQQMGRLGDAAQFALEAGNTLEAAELFERAGELRKAIDCYRQLKRWSQVATLTAKLPSPDSREVAAAWETAFESRKEELASTHDDAALEELGGLAAKVAKSLDTAGDSVRSRFYQGLTKPDALAQHLGWSATPEVPAAAAPQTKVLSAGSETRTAPVPAPVAAPAPSSTAAERYSLLDKLGQGGMGEVFRAHDNRLDRPVAIKFLPPWMTSNQMLREMFAKEAKLAASLNHPNIIIVHDYGVMDRRPYLCMELVEGRSFVDILDDHPNGIPLMELFDCARGLLEALDFAHSRGIVHRDVKPANIMRTPEGRIKLADFGIARMGDSDKTTKIVGTPAYMAPEQFRGKGVDQRTDIFAAGATLYELATGTTAFEGTDRSTPPDDPRMIRPELPEPFADALRRCMQLDSIRRYPSCAPLLEELRSTQALLEVHLRRSAADYVAPAPKPAAKKPTPEQQTAWDKMRRRHSVDTTHIGGNDER